MLEHLDRSGARLPEDKLKATYAAQIAVLKKMLGQHGAVTTLWLDHAEILADSSYGRSGVSPVARS